VSASLEFTVSGWDAYDALLAVVDDPSVTGLPTGTARECDEADNETRIELDGLCP
jgi:hypothetical protein